MEADKKIFNMDQTVFREEPANVMFRPVELCGDCELTVNGQECNRTCGNGRYAASLFVHPRINWPRNVHF